MYLIEYIVLSQSGGEESTLNGFRLREGDWIDVTLSEEPKLVVEKVMGIFLKQQQSTIGRKWGQESSG